MQRTIIFSSSQYLWNSCELWLSWPSTISSWCAPTLRALVWVLKCFNQARPSLFDVQPLGLTSMTQSRGRLWNQDVIKTFPGKMIKGGRAQPLALTPWISVTHSRLPGWIFFRLPRFSEPVKTIWPCIAPIMKPVSSKLYVSSSPIPYLALVLATSSNQGVMTRGSSFRAR
jgi:hypothetical protein